MGRPKTPSPVKLIVGILGASNELLEEAGGALRERFGPLDALSTATDWTVSTYYRDEMGPTIRRQFVSFEQLVSPDEITAVKLATNEMEQRWCTASARRVNIDPGYIAATKLVLASTKDAAHRIYLGQGIYAETTLLFSNGSFHAHAYTYPDYAASGALAFFNSVRATYLQQLRSQHS